MESNRVKVATFNANSVRARMPVIEGWLQKEVPHLLCIQETKVQDRDFPIEAFEALGYEAAFRGQKSYNGVAVLSSSPLQAVSYGLKDGEDASDETRLIQGVFQGIQVVNTYVPQGKDVDHPDFQYKLRWLERLLSHFETHFDPKRPLLWMGDLNVALEERDVYDPKRLEGHVCFHPREREALRKLVAWGLVDVFRKTRQDETAFSFWDYRIPKNVERNLGWRLDYIFATRDLAEKTVSCWIDKAPRQWTKPSDHTFVAAEFELA